VVDEAADSRDEAADEQDQVLADQPAAPDLGQALAQIETPDAQHDPTDSIDRRQNDWRG